MGGYLCVVRLCVAKATKPCSVRECATSGGRMLSAPPKRALSAQLKQALVRRHSVGVRECAAEACACTLPL